MLSTKIFILSYSSFRFNKGVLNWTNAPQKTNWNGSAFVSDPRGRWLDPPLSIDYNVIETVQTSPVIADIGTEEKEKEEKRGRGSRRQRESEWDEFLLFFGCQC